MLNSQAKTILFSDYQNVTFIQWTLIIHAQQKIQTLWNFLGWDHILISRARPSNVKSIFLKTENQSYWDSSEKSVVFLTQKESCAHPTGLQPWRVISQGWECKIISPSMRNKGVQQIHKIFSTPLAILHFINSRSVTAWQRDSGKTRYPFKKIMAIL